MRVRSGRGPCRCLQLLVCVALLAATGCQRSNRRLTLLPRLSPIATPSWKRAAALIEQDRGEPQGKLAKVDVPDELKQYSGDPHWFLGVQSAECRKLRYEVPEDYCDLASLIDRGEMVRIPFTGRDYLLFGIGGLADAGPITAFDKDLQTSIPLFADQSAEEQAAADLESQIRYATDAATHIADQVKMSRLESRARRAALARELLTKREALSRLIGSKELLDSQYGEASRAEHLFSEYRSIQGLAANFEGASYDLSKAQDRLDFKVRLLASLRPQAQIVLEEIASAYNRQFGRPLPVTSMIRTEEYQRELSETNPNAARDAVPPHTSGLAFDIYYHYMTAAEQEFLMAEIARLKDEGRVEALRETRDHFHVFAFADGEPPPHNLVAEAAGEIGAAGAIRPPRIAKRDMVPVTGNGGVKKVAYHVQK